MDQILLDVVSTVNHLSALTPSNLLWLKVHISCWHCVIHTWHHNLSASLCLVFQVRANLLFWSVFYLKLCFTVYISLLDLVINTTVLPPKPEMYLFQHVSIHLPVPAGKPLLRLYLILSSLVWSSGWNSMTHRERQIVFLSFPLLPAFTPAALWLLLLCWVMTACVQGSSRLWRETSPADLSSFIVRLSCLFRCRRSPKTRDIYWFETL